MDLSIELIEAIKEYYKDDEDLQTDILLWLSHLDEKQQDKLIRNCECELDSMGRCMRCGQPLEVMYYKEYHSEVNAYETLSDIYCPNCDIIGGENNG